MSSPCCDSAIIVQKREGKAAGGHFKFIGGTPSLA